MTRESQVQIECQGAERANMGFWGGDDHDLVGWDRGGGGGKGKLREGDTWRR
jgi:hypothetical protein